MQQRSRISSVLVIVVEENIPDRSGFVFCLFHNSYRGWCSLSSCSKSSNLCHGDSSLDVSDVSSVWCQAASAQTASLSSRCSSLNLFLIKENEAAVTRQQSVLRLRPQTTVFRIQSACMHLQKKGPKKLCCSLHARLSWTAAHHELYMVLLECGDKKRWSKCCIIFLNFDK